MRDGFKIVDLDRHMIEPMELWAKRLPASKQHLVPRLQPVGAHAQHSATELGHLGIPCVAGEPLMVGVSTLANLEVARIAAGRGELFRAAQSGFGQLESMNATGVDQAVLLPTFAPFLAYNEAISAEDSRAYARVYNDWLALQCGVDRERLIGAALISRHDPAAMLDDLEHGLALGHRAVVLRPNPVRGRHLGAVEYAEFWQACAERSIPVLLHEGSHTRVATAGADRFRTHFAQHACSHPIEMMMGFLALLEGGVLEANPTLRVAFLESGCGWLPYWLWRLDHIEFAQLAREVQGVINRPPSEYFREQCWIAFEPSEALLPEFIRAIGRASVVFGTDFPHPDHGTGIVDELLARRGEIDDETLREILWESPQALLNG